MQKETMYIFYLSDLHCEDNYLTKYLHLPYYVVEQF